jgi:hypothetical protein
MRKLAQLAGVSVRDDGVRVPDYGMSVPGAI